MQFQTSNPKISKMNEDYQFLIYYRENVIYDLTNMDFHGFDNKKINKILKASINKDEYSRYIKLLKKYCFDALVDKDYNTWELEMALVENDREYLLYKQINKQWDCDICITFIKKLLLKAIKKECNNLKR